MIIHCLSCGKSISSHGHNCPYCFSELTQLTLEMNGVIDRPRFKERMISLMLTLVHK